MTGASSPGLWKLYTLGLQGVEKVQNRATRFVTRNNTFEDGSMTGILGKLNGKLSKRKRITDLYCYMYRKV